MSESDRVVTVLIQGQRYPIRSTLDQEYIARLAAYVDDRIRIAGEASPAGDSVRISVLAALNIADELFRCRETSRNRSGAVAERTEELERIVDRVLMAH